MAEGGDEAEREEAVEFDLVARWTADSIDRLGVDAVPAACRGSGGPSALAWLADWLTEAGSGSRTFLDLGAGLGGPSAWLRRTHGTEPVLTDPMVGALRASRRCFSTSAVAAGGERLPFPAGTFAAAWALGVLSTVEDQRATLAELQRVLVPGGRAGLVVYVAEVNPVPDPPAATTFLPWHEVAALLADIGFTFIESVALADLADADPDWRACADAVDRDLEAHHGDDPRWQEDRSQEDRIAELLDDGAVAGHALRLRAD